MLTSMVERRVESLFFSFDNSSSKGEDLDPMEGLRARGGSAVPSKVLLGLRVLAFLGGISAT